MKEVVNINKILKVKALPLYLRRGMENELVLDKHSFQLVDCPTSLTTWDFYNDEQKIHDVYYKEMEDVLKKYTGCEYVHVFHHQVQSCHL